MRLNPLALVLCLGAACSAFAPAPPPLLPPNDPPPRETMDGGLTDGAVTLEAAVFTGETAWLVAHLADEPDPSHGGDSDSVRRLSQMGVEGVLAVAEVFRVGDARRIPYARRVIERVALRRCLRDHGRAAWRVTALERGTTTHAIDHDAGIVWTSGDARWSNEAVERVRQWARDGMPCGDPTSVDAGAG